MKHTSDTALVTGAASGIGLELARQFARNQHPVVIVAPDQRELEDIAHHLRMEFSVTVLPIAENLLEQGAEARILAQIEGEELSIDILANSAGLGQRGKFWEIPLARDLETIRLNIGAAIHLTKLLLPFMMARGRGRILNTASVAGFEPGPLLAIYHATKAFMLSWSEALASELEGTGVTVTALCPGPVETDFFPTAGMRETHAFQKTNRMAPQDVAKTAYQAMMDGERVIIPGATNKAVVFSRPLMPESSHAMKSKATDRKVATKGPTRRRGDIERKAALKNGQAGPLR